MRLCLFYRRPINQLIERLPEIKLERESLEIIKYLNDLAKFIARARGMVLTRAAEFLNAENEKVTFYEPVEIQIEEPFRALLQLRVLARALAIAMGNNIVGDEEIRLVRAVALSSMPADRSLLISVIVTEERSWSAKEVADKLGISPKTARRQMDELVSLGIFAKKEQGEGLPHLYSVQPSFCHVLYGGEEFMSNPTGTQTPPRVFDKETEDEGLSELSPEYRAEVEGQVIKALAELTGTKGYVRGYDVAQKTGCPYIWVKQLLETLVVSKRVLQLEVGKDMWAATLATRNQLKGIPGN